MAQAGAVAPDATPGPKQTLIESSFRAGAECAGVDDCSPRSKDTSRYSPESHLPARRTCSTKPARKPAASADAYKLGQQLCDDLLRHPRRTRQKHSFTPVTLGPRPMPTSSSTARPWKPAAITNELAPIPARKKFSAMRSRRNRGRSRHIDEGSFGGRTGADRGAQIRKIVENPLRAVPRGGPALTGSEVGRFFPLSQSKSTAQERNGTFIAATLAGRWLRRAEGVMP